MPNRYLYWITRSPLEDNFIEDKSIRFRILNDKELNDVQHAYLSYIINLPDIFDLNEFKVEEVNLLLKQSGINFDLILNPKILKTILDINKEIDKILIEQFHFQAYIRKEKVYKILNEKGFGDFSKEYIFQLIEKTSKNLNFKLTRDIV